MFKVGVVANRYVKLNSDWNTPKYLNLMNNLICGVPMSFMKNIKESYYLQLSNQVLVILTLFVIKNPLLTISIYFLKITFFTQCIM